MKICIKRGSIILYLSEGDNGKHQRSIETKEQDFFFSDSLMALFMSKLLKFCVLEKREYLVQGRILMVFLILRNRNAQINKPFFKSNIREDQVVRYLKLTPQFHMPMRHLDNLRI